MDQELMAALEAQLDDIRTALIKNEVDRSQLLRAKELIDAMLAPATTDDGLVPAALAVSGDVMGDL